MSFVLEASPPRPTPTDGRPTLALVMIVKVGAADHCYRPTDHCTLSPVWPQDEAHTLPQTLISLKGAIDYYVILDTGTGLVVLDFLHLPGSDCHLLPRAISMAGGLPRAVWLEPTPSG